MYQATKENYIKWKQYEVEIKWMICFLKYIILCFF